MSVTKSITPVNSPQKLSSPDRDTRKSGSVKSQYRSTISAPPAILLHNLNDNFKEKICSVPLLPLFLSSIKTNDGIEHVVNIDGINVRLCNNEVMNEINTTLERNDADKQAGAFNNRYTMVPFKIAKKGSPLIISHDATNHYDSDELEKRPPVRVVRDKFAAPLSDDEMKKLDHLLEKFNIILSNERPLIDFDELAKEIFEPEVLEKWNKREKNDDFYHSYLYFRKLFQNVYSFRMGLIDGAHRATLIFYTIQGLRLTDTCLKRHNTLSWEELHISVMTRATWEYFEYTQTTTFTPDLLSFLYQKSETTQKDSALTVPQTICSCIVTGLEKILQIYREFNNMCYGRVAEGKVTSDMDENEKMNIIKLVDSRRYNELNDLIGCALPEINNKCYFDQHCHASTLAKVTTFKELRESICWQIWIEHFWSVYPDFRQTQERRMMKNASFKKLHGVLFRNKDIGELSEKDVMLFDSFKDDDGETTTMRARIMKEFASNNTENKILWWLKKMMEMLAKSKNSPVTATDIVSKIGGANPSRYCIWINVRNVLQFMTHISYTQEELLKNLDILQKLDGKNKISFYTHIGKLYNYKICTVCTIQI